MENNIDTLKDQVFYCLRNFTETRNSDKFLTWKIWQTFHHVEVKIDHAQFMLLPSEDDVRRVRAHIQNTLKQLVPTEKQVAIQRKWREEEWLEALGYKPGDQMEMFLK